MKKIILVLFGVFLLVHIKEVIGAKPKYAPKYCLRFKFDCTSAEKKGHVCCLFPLPIDGNGVEMKTTLPQAGPVASIGVKKIRPLRLPSSRNGEEAVQENSFQGQKRYDVFNQKKKAKQDAESVTTAPQRKEPSKKKETIERESGGKPANAGAGLKRPKRPRICRRLVVNCRKNPAHTCCKLKEHEQKEGKEQLETKEENKQLINKTADNIVETTQNVKKPEISRIRPESTLQRLRPLPDRSHRGKPKIKIVPVKVRNSDVKQHLEVNIPSTTPATEDNGTTNKIDASKTEAKIVATIEAVPLDVFERNDSTNGGSPSGKQKAEKLKTRQRSQGPLDVPTATAASKGPESADDSTHLSKEAALLDLPLAKEEEPYERIPAECFTMSFDCKTSPTHMCCAYHQ